MDRIKYAYYHELTLKDVCVYGSHRAVPDLGLGVLTLRHYLNSSLGFVLLHSRFVFRTLTAPPSSMRPKHPVP